MRRLFYKGILADTIEIGGPDAHHLMHVMRAKPGQEVIVVDDENQVARMEMVAFSAEKVTLQLKERLEANTESPIELALGICLLKADKMDFVVQKAVELGGNRIVPIFSHNCVVRYDDKKAKQRRDRWQKIADEAAKQCGRTALVEVLPIETMKKFLEHAPYEDDMDTEFLFCYENEDKLSLKEKPAAHDVEALSAAGRPRGRLYTRRSRGHCRGRRAERDTRAAHPAGRDGRRGRTQHCTI